MGVMHPTIFKWTKPGPRITWDPIPNTEYYVIYTGPNQNEMKLTALVPGSVVPEINVPEGTIYALGFAFNNNYPYGTTPFKIENAQVSTEEYADA